MPLVKAFSFVWMYRRDDSALVGCSSYFPRLQQLAMSTRIYACRHKRTRERKKQEDICRIFRYVETESVCVTPASVSQARRVVPMCAATSIPPCGRFQLKLVYGCGHSVQEDQPHETASSIMNFAVRYVGRTNQKRPGQATPGRKTLCCLQAHPCVLLFCFVCRLSTGGSCVIQPFPRPQAISALF